MFDYSASTLFWALIGGILPALGWLWFWLREDQHPEPKRMILFAFLGGMLVIPFVVPFQGYAKEHFESMTIVIILWALVEELFKFIAGWITSLSKKADDEPVDPMIYMITTALGFAALENVLFILDPIESGRITFSVITGNLRFVGATLLHVISSSAIGIALGLAFYKGPVARTLSCIGGLVVAVLLHSLFNFFIMNTNGEKIFVVFFAVWIGVISLALFFEKVKTVTRKN